MWGIHDIKALVQLADTSDVPYFVTGGVALDALPERQRLTRKHGDINLVLPETGIKEFKQGLGRGVSWYTKLVLPRGVINGFEIELWPYTRQDGFYIVPGEKSTRFYPEELLEGQQGSLGNLELRIASNEQLRYDGLHKAGIRKRPEDIVVLDAIAARMNSDLYEAIKDVPRTK